MPKVASPPLPRSVTAGQLARSLGVSERVVLGRKGDGRLPVVEGGGIDLDAIIRAGVAVLAAERGSTSFEEARTRLLTEQANGQAMRNAVLRGVLIGVDEVEGVIGTVIDAQRTGLLQLPSRVTPLIAGETDQTRIFAVLTATVHEILGQLAATEFTAVEGQPMLHRRPPNGANGHG